MKPKRLDAPTSTRQRRAERWAGAWEQAREEGETGCAGEGKKEKGWAASWAAWAEVGRREREKGLQAGLVWVLGCYGFGFEFCFGFSFYFSFSISNPNYHSTR